MALRNDAEFEFAPVGARVIVNNPDGSMPTTTAGALSAAGTFDFSGVVSIAAVSITVKIDNAAAVTDTIDLTAAVDDAAVTPAEFVAAFNAVGSIGPGSSTTASVVDGRVKVVKPTPGATKYLQVYGEAAELAGFGYGYGAVILPIQTQQSIADAPTQKESERLAITDSLGLDTAIITRGYRTGATLTLTDTAMDQELRAVLEGGTWNPTTKVYSVPTSSSTKPTFTFESWSGIYEKDDNLEANMVGYLQKVSRACTGTFGERAGDRNLQARTYTINVTPYRDPSTGTRYPDTDETTLTVAAFDALDVWDV